MQVSNNNINQICLIILCLSVLDVSPSSLLASGVRTQTVGMACSKLKPSTLSAGALAISINIVAESKKTLMIIYYCVAMYDRQMLAGSSVEESCLEALKQKDIFIVELEHYITSLQQTLNEKQNKYE